MVKYLIHLLFFASFVLLFGCVSSDKPPDDFSPTLSSSAPELLPCRQLAEQKDVFATYNCVVEKSILYGRKDFCQYAPFWERCSTYPTECAIRDNATCEVWEFPNGWFFLPNFMAGNETLLELTKEMSGRGLFQVNGVNPCIVTNPHPSGNEQILCTTKGWTPIFVAINRNDLQLVQYLISLDADVNAKDSHGETPLMLAAGKINNIPALQLLIENGADINATDEYGSQALTHAVYDYPTSSWEYSENIGFLLDRGADPNFVNMGGDSVLIFVHSNNDAVRKFLVEHGAECHSKNKALMENCLRQTQILNATDACLKMNSTAERDSCYFQNAMQTGGRNSICGRIMDPEMRDKCAYPRQELIDKYNQSAKNSSSANAYYSYYSRVDAGGNSNDTPSGANWTEWYNRDTPGGDGDFETLSDMPDVCAHPIAIECRAKRTGEYQPNKNFICEPELGGICENSKNPEGCHDYEVRFLCSPD